MKAKIISDNKLFIVTLKAYLKTMFGGAETKDLILIDANKISDYSQKRRPDTASVTLAKEYARNSKNIIIILGLGKKSFLTRYDENFASLMKFSNVGFINILAKIDILLKYRKLAAKRCLE